MKTPYIFLAVISIIMYNVVLIQRDHRMFDSYDRICAELPTGHPDCVFAKRK
jgi:hypothetical protein